MQSFYEMAIETIAKHYGLEHQQLKAIEELGEASAAIARYIVDPGDGGLKDMASELADVQIMIDQLLVLNPMLEYHFERQKKYKTGRQIQRMVEDAGLEIDRT